MLSVALNVPAPPFSVLSAGNVAALSVLVKCTVPLYPISVLLNGSFAVTVKLMGLPTVALPGAG